jgi:hypothetical protein
MMTTLEAIEKYGTRDTAMKMINIKIYKIAGIDAHDLPDTYTLEEGLDRIEDLLRVKETKKAWVEARLTATEMLKEEGFLV